MTAKHKPPESLHPRRTDSPRGQDMLWALLLAAICTLINLNKSVHIDDAAHLRIAEWIARNPAHPMRGTLHWSNGPEPIHHTNQPHLFFYLLAGIYRLFGEHRIWAYHLLEGLFIFIGAVAFIRLLKRVWSTERGLSWGAAAALFLGPAVLPGQNIMVDVPLMALMMLSAERLTADQSARSIVMSSLFLGLACLMKYSALPLLFIYPLLGLRFRQPRFLYGLLVPAVALLGWSLFNWIDYGGVHLLERPTGIPQSFAWYERAGIALVRAVLFVVTLGATNPFAWVRLVELCMGRGARSRALWVLFLIGLGALLNTLTTLGPPQIRNEFWGRSQLRVLFFAAGLVSFADVARALRQIPSRSETMPVGSSTLDPRVSLVLVLLVALPTLFVIFLAPFVAVRHTMLVTPWVIFATLSRWRTTQSRKLIYAAVVSSVLAGTVLAYSDCQAARSYEELANSGATRARQLSSGEIYSVGAWGFRYYATELGVQAYHPGVQLRPGDALVVAPAVEGPAVPPDCHRVEVIHAPTFWLAFVPTLTVTRGGYYSVWESLPWSLEPPTPISAEICIVEGP